MRLQIYFNISFVIFILNLNLTSTYKFLDIDAMKKLVESESKLLKQFNKFIVKQQNQLHKLKLKVRDLEHANERTIQKGEKYYSNPINVFSLIRRFAVDWLEIEEYIFNDKFMGIIMSHKKFSNFPIKNDLNISVDALFWLQDIYNLSTSSLVAGKINGIDYNTLTAKDCYEIGLKAYEKQDFYHSVTWLNEAYQLDDHDNSFLSKTILQALAESYFQIGDVKKAVNISNKILELFNDLSAQRTRTFYGSRKNHNQQNNMFINKFPYQLYHNLLQPNSSFPQLCRNEENKNNQKSKYLNCVYENNHIPFLFIAPFKKEILSNEPLLVIFHDVLSDEEINILKENSKDDLSVAQEQIGNKKVPAVTNKRNNKVKWFFDDNEPNLLFDIKKRAGDMTNLNMNSTDAFNVNYYEVGGYYTPHNDSNDNEGYAYGNILDTTGNRIATLIFYMNNVEEGGATVFPVISISVQPKKGSALFWYNLHSSGEIDSRFLHGACPILLGYKWISTLWIREKLQDIHRPCVESSRIIK